jgi:hypothetical protein
MLISVAFVLATPLVALAQSAIEWTSNEPLTGEEVEGELFVEVGEEGLYPLLVIEEPDVQPPRFQIDGTVRHEDVAGTAYFEMWTVLADESRYFTRTLADSGPLESMTGTSQQRPFSLPFELGEGGPVPIRLEINLVTEGSGRFWVGPLSIVPSSAEPATTAAPPITSDATADIGDGDEAGDSSLWWGLGALVVVGAAATFGWLSSIRRRRAEEQRRMNAMDSLRS